MERRCGEKGGDEGFKGEGRSDRWPMMGRGRDPLDYVGLWCALTLTKPQRVRRLRPPDSI